MLHKNRNHLRRAKPLLGTFVEVSLYSSWHDTQLLDSVITKCFQVIRHVQNTMSYFDNSSEIFRLNHSEPRHPVSVSKETWDLLKLSRDMYKNSRGNFDILYRGREQNPNSDISFHDDLMVSRNEHAEVDLGGIAKGYAADQAAATAAGYPEISGVINAGGDIVFFGSESFPLIIRSPNHDGRFLDVGHFKNCAVATSVFNQDNKPHSVSVLAHSCIVADPLTKGIWLHDEDQRKDLLSQYEAQYMEIDVNLNISRGALLH